MQTTSHLPMRGRRLAVEDENGKRITIRIPRQSRGNERRRAIADSLGAR